MRIRMIASILNQHSIEFSYCSAGIIALEYYGDGSYIEQLFDVNSNLGDIYSWLGY